MKRLCVLLLAAALLTPTVHAAPAPFSGQLSADAALLMERDTGIVLYEKNAHAQHVPASVPKVMTLLLLFEALDAGLIGRDETVTVSANAAGMGGSQVYLKEGEQFSVWELLKCVTVASANDAAVALAEHLAGSEEAFVARMNQRAAQLGMADTHFLNCTGLPAAGHLTSAYDIALMSRQLILDHPAVREFTTIWMDSFRDGTFGLTNTNRLVRFYNGATGLKTGSTSSAGCCISATAERDGMELIAVILKAPTSPQRFEDAKALLDYGFASCALAAVYPDAPLSPIPVVLGESAQVQPVLQRDCRLLVARGEEGQITTRVTLPDDLEAPVEQDQLLGQMEVYVGDELRDTVPILAGQPVARLTTGGIFSRLLRQLLMAE